MRSRVYEKYANYRDYLPMIEDDKTVPEIAILTAKKVAAEYDLRYMAILESVSEPLKWERLPNTCYIGDIVGERYKKIDRALYEDNLRIYFCEDFDTVKKKGPYVKVADNKTCVGLCPLQCHSIILLSEGGDITTAHIEIGPLNRINTKDKSGICKVSRPVIDEEGYPQYQPLHGITYTNTTGNGATACLALLLDKYREACREIK